MKLLKEVMEEIKSSKIPFYVYILYKQNSTPFYVGKGTCSKFSRAHSERIVAHEFEAKLNEPYETHPQMNLLKINTINKIWRNGDQILYEIDSWHDQEIDAYKREMELIAFIGRRTEGTGSLTNITEGGEKEATTLITRQKISATLKEYFKNPEVLKANSERGIKYYKDHPEAVEIHRKSAIKNNTSENLARWRREKPEELVAKMAKHSDEMKKWYIDNPEDAKKMAENRNKVLKGDKNRQNMSEKTRLYNKNNPEEHQKRREKAKESLRKTYIEYDEIKQKCLMIIRDKLFELGEIADKHTIKYSMFEKWRKMGLIEKHFPTFPTGRIKFEIWKEFLGSVAS